MRFRLALYGHPLAGLYWGQHAHGAVKECGFHPVPDWDCMFHHTELQLMLGVYVDGVKLAGEEENIQKGWKRLESHIDFDEPTQFGEFLGCSQKETSVDWEDFRAKQAFYAEISTIAAYIM